MGSLSHQSTTIEINDNVQAKLLLKRMCKAISNTHNLHINFISYPDGMAGIISENNELGIVILPTKSYKAFFKSASDLVNALLIPGSILSFKEMEISIDKEFGYALEEIMIKLDLMKV